MNNDLLAGIDVICEFDAELFCFLQPSLQHGIGFDRSRLELGDRGVGERGRLHQIRHHLAQLVAVRMQPLQPLVEDNAVPDRRRQKNGDSCFDNNAKRHPKHHLFSCVSSNASKAAIVTLGGLRGRDTRTET